MKLNTFSTKFSIFKEMPSSAFLFGELKKLSYLVDSKSTWGLAGYFLGLPLPRLA
jgi:hypothetical protein